MAAEPHPDPENGAWCARCGHLWEMHAETGACQAAWSNATEGNRFNVAACSCPEFVGSRVPGAEGFGPVVAYTTESGLEGVKPFDRPEDEVSTPEEVEDDEYTFLERWLATPVFRSDVVLILFGLFVVWAATR